MKHNKLSIRFVILKAKINKQGLCPISCRLTFKSKRKAFSTGLFVQPEHWDSKKQKASNKFKEFQVLNGNLAQIHHKLNNTALSIQIKSKEFTAEDIFNNYIGKTSKKEILLVEFFETYLIKRKKLIGIDLKRATWLKFYYVNEQLKDFITKNYNKKDLQLNKLNYLFINDFEYYLKTVKTQKQVTVNKTLQRFRMCIREAINKGYLQNDPFSSYKPKSTLKEVVFLSNEELKQLEKHVFNQPRLEIVKDLFIFCCYTGLAYREMSNLASKHIIKGFDGNEWIKIKREKTNKIVSVPLLPRAKAILEKYESINDRILPKYSNQKINSYLKEIADILGIKKRISHHTARKTFASTVLLFNDIPMEIVSELLGHSSIQITQQYYGKVVQKKISKEMNLLKSKLENQ
jgi:integrase